MENWWIVYSLGGLIVLGLSDFIKKVVIEKGGDKDLFLLAGFIGTSILFSLNFLVQGNYHISYELLKAGIILGLIDFFIPLGKITSLKYLDVSFSFVAIRVITSFLILFIGINIMGESLTIYNIIGFLMGVVAIFMLSGFKFGEPHKISRKGILAVGITIVAITLSHSYLKYIVGDININHLMLVKVVTSCMCGFIYIGGKNRFSTCNTKNLKIIFPYVVIACSIMFLHFLIFLPNIYLLGPLSLGYKIISYSLVVPILLSIIFYKEKMNATRVIAFILTIISIWLFIY